VVNSLSHYLKYSFITLDMHHLKLQRKKLQQLLTDSTHYPSLPLNKYNKQTN